MKFYFRGSPTPQKTTIEKYCYPPSSKREPDSPTKVIPAPKPHHENSPKPPQKPPRFSPTPPPSPSCPNPKPHHKKKKIDFKAVKKDTINSLHEVENFLCNFQNIHKYIKLYKILR